MRLSRLRTAGPVEASGLRMARSSRIKEKRLLTGFEALRVQGFPEAPLVQFAKDQGGPAAVDSKFFDLAGNAFSAT